MHKAIWPLVTLVLMIFSFEMGAPHGTAAHAARDGRDIAGRSRRTSAGSSTKDFASNSRSGPMRGR